MMTYYYRFGLDSSKEEDGGRALLSLRSLSSLKRKHK